MYIKIITLLIAGAVFITGLIMGFGGYVFAGDPIDGIDIALDEIPNGRVSDTIYDSSFSEIKSIGKVRMEVGDVLLGYGFGGEYINQITEALEGNGVYGAELKSFFIAVGLDEREARDILLAFDKIGISQDTSQPAPATGSVNEGDTGTQGGQNQVSSPDATGAVPSAGDPIADIDIALDEIPAGRIFHTPDDNNAFREAAVNLIEKLKAAHGAGSITEDVTNKEIRQELEANRDMLQTGAETLRQNLRENAKDLRDNFRENVRATIGHVDHGKTGRLALAHGKGLRMVNRYRSAIARFDHILGRLESRIEKIGIEIEAEARASKGKVKETFPPDNLAVLIEEAKNMQSLNKAKLAELEAKYELLLLGGNIQGVTLRGFIKVSDNRIIGEEAREIAKELKSEIEKLHGVLDDIKQASVDYNSSRSNVKL